MNAITLPEDLERTIRQEAARRGTTTDLLIIDALRASFVSCPEEPVAHGQTALDLLGNVVGCVTGPGEAWSENTGARFADEVMSKRNKRDAD